MDSFNTSGLSSLRSQEQVDLIDEIDALSRSGLGEHVSLPQIAVCGDQSSGKSSCLEAISGVPFPRKDTLCTRFATELVLRKAPEKCTRGRIIPDPRRPASEREKLSEFEYTLQGFDELPALIEAAKHDMGLDPNGSGFSADILRIEISGPARPHLTVVDLPGLIHGKNDDQDDENIEDVVSELVDSYMRRPRTLILAVVSAQSDRALQAILKRAKAVDPSGKRTMGLITKPDALPAGSDSEKEFLRLATNDITKFRLGWHVLKNRDYDMRNSSDVERDERELDFFSRGAWADLPRGILGVSSLRERLSKVLLEHIRSELPALMDEIQEILSNCSQALGKLGDSRKTLDQQRIYLLKNSQSFTTICKSSCDGMYEDSFFTDSSDLKARSRRFRAIVQNLNSRFAEEIRMRGHYIELEGGGEGGKNERAISWARDILVNSRGRELPGTFSPMLIGDLFRVQSEPWVEIANAHLLDVWTKAKRHVKTILASLMDRDTCTALSLHWVDREMDTSFISAQERINRLFVDRRHHVITYNHYFTENIQKCFNTRNEEKILKTIEQYFPIGKDENGYVKRIGPENLAGFSISLAQTVTDMDTYASIELLDHLQAFYKVAMKTFVDNVAIQVIEPILRSLVDIFTPVAVVQMNDELLATIASESQETSTQRELLQKKLNTMEKGMKICKRHAAYHDADVELESISSGSPSETVTPEPPSIQDEERQTDHGDTVQIPPPVEELPSESPVVIDNWDFAVPSKKAKKSRFKKSVRSFQFSLD